MCSKVRKQTTHLAVNVLGVAKRAVALAKTYRAEPARPRVNILEQMTMDGAIVPIVEVPGGKRLIRPLRRDEGLKFGEFRRIAEIEAVLEDVGARVAVGILDGLVHAAVNRREP